jgi:F-type H+-transporting ATPase subunit delta
VFIVDMRFSNKKDVGSVPPALVIGDWVHAAYDRFELVLALERKEPEVFQHGLGRLAELTRDEAVMALFENPKLPFEAKERLLREGLEGVHPLVVNLALLLVSKDGLRLAGDVANHFNLLFDAHRGIEHAEVTTAVSLEEKDREVLSNRIGEILGRRVVLDLRVDPSVIGGFVVRIGDMLIDGSIRQSLDSLGRDLLEMNRS